MTIMKKLNLIGMAMLCFGTTQAQPVLDSAGKLTIGMEFRYLTNDGWNLGAGNAGPAQTWNFNDSFSTDTLLRSVVHPDSTPLSGLYPAADYAVKSSDGTYEILDEAGADNYVLAYITNQNLHLHYTNTYKSMSRPLNYGFSFTDTIATSYSIAGENYSGTGLASLVVDGWGTLQLPGITMPNTLRVRTVQEYADTGATSGMVTLSKIISYSWYDSSSRLPVFSVDSVLISNPFFSDTIASASRLVKDVISGVSQVASDAFSVYAADGKLYIEGTFSRTATVEAGVYDLAGRKVYGTRKTAPGITERIELALPVLPDSQVYIVRLLIQSGTRQTLRTIKLGY